MSGPRLVRRLLAAALLGIVVYGVFVVVRGYRVIGAQLGSFDWWYFAAALGLTGTEQKLLPTLGVGQGLWKIKSRSFISQHQLHPVELELFRTDARYLGGQS